MIIVIADALLYQKLYVILYYALHSCYCCSCRVQFR